MIHMLSAFDLKPGEDLAAFQTAYAAFIEELCDADLIAASGPVGRRVRGTPMDTDDRSLDYFSVMSFRDRAQMDGAHAHLENRLDPATKPHKDMYGRIMNSVFLCWQDDT